MRLEIRFRRSAENDLKALHDYIARDSLERADAFIGRIRERCFQLADFPELGPRRDDIRKGIRLLSVDRRAVIAYEIRSTVRILRVFYRGRHVEALLSPGRST
jgi:toxin ParE1/3/4